MRVHHPVLLAMVTVCAAVLRTGAFETTNWLSSVAEGYYNDPANWTGGFLPTNGNTGQFTGDQDYVVRFPQGGLVENSVTKVSGLSNGRSVTFDTRGTWWLKAGCDAWPNDWTAFQLGANSSHFFNIEGVLKAAANDYPVMEMSNALFRVQYHSTGMTNVLEEGLLNLYNPGGIHRSAHSLITGSTAPANSLILFKTNSMLRANNVRLRGNRNGHLMRFEGGTHEIYNGMTIAEGGANAGTTCTVEVAGGTLAVRSGSVYVDNKVGTHGNLVIEGSGDMTVRDLVYVAYNATNCSGTVILRDAGRLAVGGDFRIAQFNKTTGELRIADEAALSVASAMRVSYASASTAAVDVAGSAALAVTGQVTVACASESYAEMAVRDNATVYAGGDLLVGDAGGNAVFTLDDAATLVVKGAALTVAGNSGTASRGRLILTGGTLEANAVRGGVGALCRGGTGGAELLADGTTLRAGGATTGLFLGGFDQAELGAQGLTLDSAGTDLGMGQPFSDLPGATGLFVKTGAGTLSVSNSLHGRTEIARGVLRASEPAAFFGREIAVSNIASLSLEGEAVTLTAGDLTLGSPGGRAILALDAGDSVSVTNALTLHGCAIYFGGAETAGTHTLIRSAGTIDPSCLDHVELLNPAAGKAYAFAIGTDGGGETIQLIVSAYTIADAEWDGSESADWNTADNWTPAGVPTYGTRAKFGAAAARKAVTLSAPGLTTFMEFDSDAGYTLGGTQPLTLPAGMIDNKLGEHEIALPLTLSGEVALPTAAAATTTVSGPVSANLAARVAKSGSGMVVLSGDNAGFQGAWRTGGGRMVFATAGAWGAANSAADAVTVGAGTLTYSGTPAEVSKGIMVDAGGSTLSAILEVKSDLTVNGTVTNHSGILIKRGVGTLTLNVGAGHGNLSSGSGGSASNNDPSGIITFPENGDSPATDNGLGGFNLLEGTLRIRGVNSTLSIVNQRHFGVLGGAVSSCLADPTLELDAVRLNQGGSGQHLIVGNQIQAGSLARSPTLRLVNGAHLAMDHLRIGRNSAAMVTPTLIMSNATVEASWQVSFGADSTVTPYVRIMEGSQIIAKGGAPWGGGICFSRNVDMVVSGNSVVSQTHSDGDMRFNEGGADGTVRWEDGAVMRFAKFSGRNHNTADGLDMIFDNATMEILANGYSYSTRADKQSFIIEDGGLTVKVGSGIRHELTFPLTGAGALTKTGAGELVFAAGLNYTPSATNLTGLATGDYTGGTLVQEGALSVSNGTIRTDAAVRVAAGARLNLSNSGVALGEVSGSGLITNGTLTAGYRCRVTPAGADRLTLSDVTLPSGFMVTFDAEAGSELVSGQKVAIADLAGATVPNLDKWSARHVGEKLSARFTLEGGTVYANVFYSAGTLFQLR